jgi:hypothetical protein
MDRCPVLDMATNREVSEQLSVLRQYGVIFEIRGGPLEFCDRAYRQYCEQLHGLVSLDICE